MAKDYMGYETLIDDAMRGVVKAVLQRAAKQGLIGGHHFYVTFKTKDAGVDIPDFLRERYPDEMTIVLQNQFWGLKVLEDRFEVGLSFQKMPTTLTIPFAALTAFADPSTQFGLQFRNSSAQADGAGPQTVPAKFPEKAEEKASAPPPPAPKETPAPSSETPPEQTSPQVVSLDKFRKK